MRIRTRSLLARLNLVCTIAVLAPIGSTRGEGLEWLGWLPVGAGEAPYSEAAAVSADGRTVVGTSGVMGPGERVGKIRAFRWTEGRGMQDLGNLSAGHWAGATGVSGDGKVVVGWGQIPDGEAKILQDGFLWKEGEGMKPLLVVRPGDNVLTRAQAMAVSADGRVIVGYREGVQGDKVIFQAFRQDRGELVLARSQGDATVDINLREFNAVSRDGSVFVGVVKVERADDPGAVWLEAIVADPVAGFTRLGFMEDEIRVSKARAVTSDGTSVVGEGLTPKGQRAFLWAKGRGMVDLGTIPGTAYQAEAAGVADGGTRVVGRCFAPKLPETAFLWTPKSGMQPLSRVLEEAGIAIPAGWSLETATAITPDGRTIVGRARDSASQRIQAYRVRLPEKPID